MFVSFRKSFIAVAVLLVLATSIVPSRVCSISVFCPVREARAQGIMDNPMMLMMLMMMLMQMFNQGGGLQGKQKERSAEGIGNLAGSGSGGGSNPSNLPGPSNPNNQIPNQNPNTVPANPGVPNSNPSGSFFPTLPNSPFFSALPR